MELTEAVYSGSPETARGLARELERHGILCFVEDEYAFSVYTGTRVPVSAALRVAPEDREAAALVRTEWEANAPARLGAAMQRVLAVVLLSLVPAVLWLVAEAALPDATPDPSLLGVGGLLLVSAIVVGQVEGRRHRSERLPGRPGMHR